MKYFKLYFFIGIIICFNAFKAIASKDSVCLSSEVYLFYPYPMLPSLEPINCGVGAEVSENFNPFKASVGVFVYRIQSVANIGTTQKQVLNIDYINFPILVKIKLNRLNSKNVLLLNTGFVINVPRNYKNTLYDNNNNVLKQDVAAKYGNGTSLRLGLQYSKFVKQRLSFYSSVYCDLKFQKDVINIYSQTPHPGNDSYEGASMFWGVSVGMEFSFNGYAKHL